MLKEKIQEIWTIENPLQKKRLTEKAKLFDFSRHNKKEIEELILLMRKIMVAHHGIGLAAPQIGLDVQIFVAQLPSKDGRGYEGKFYSIFNPQIISTSQKKVEDYEGCLSIPKTYGLVSRFQKLEIQYLDKNQKKVFLKVEGLLARIFQHEIDHLNGILFIDKAKNIEKI